MVSISEGTLYRLVKAGALPPPVQLTPGGSVAWYEDEIAAWQASLKTVTPETQRQVAMGSTKRGRPSLNKQRGGEV